MKTLFIALAIVVSLISSTQAQTSANTSVVSVNSSSDEQAIKQVIDDETKGFMTRNQQKWSNAWVHAPYVSWSSERTPSQILGWDNLNQSFSYNFASGQPPRPSTAFERETYQVSVLDKVATATFVQTAKSEDGRTLGKTREVRVLEKQANEWKLIYVHSRTIN